MQLDKSIYWLVPGMITLVIFALFLTRIEADFAGRAYAAYGGVYIASSLLFMWTVEDIRPDRWDTIGATICLFGATVILWGPRTV